MKKKMTESEKSKDGYPIYPESEDIYNKKKKKVDHHPAATLVDKLDVPGSELDYASNYLNLIYRNESI